jgi:ribosomal protein S18 acetylase RimI-like enzyme
MAERLANPLLNLPEGTLAARQGGRIIALGLAAVRQAAAPVHVMDLWGGGVHPGHRRCGYGRRIIDWALRIAPVLHGVPDGVTIVTWTPELDEQSREVRNAAFRDHWSSTPHTPESWKRVITGTAAFHPEGSFLAMAGRDAVGCLLTHDREADTAATGVREAWIQIIATVGEWRGRGVASALIAHALTSFKAQGYGSAALSVDAANGTARCAEIVRCRHGSGLGAGDGPRLRRSRRTPATGQHPRQTRPRTPHAAR